MFCCFLGVGYSIKNKSKVREAKLYYFAIEQWILFELAISLHGDGLLHNFFFNILL